MDNNFSEIFNKFSDILKEKNIDLNNITNNIQESCEDTDNSEFQFDIETILKLKEMISKINQNQNCPRNKLLYSLEPYLKENKKEKLEQYIKIANIISVLENMDLGFTLPLNNKQGYDFILIITLLLIAL